MKTLVIVLCGFVMFAVLGCTGSATKNSAETASAKKPADPVRTVVKKPIAGEADNTFSLSVPFESVTLAQGEEKSMLIGINRGENFREQVAIEVSGLPQGVTLETAKPVIKQGDADAALMLKATPDAALGDFTIKVTGQTASSGADFSKEVNLTVAQK